MNTGPVVTQDTSHTERLGLLGWCLGHEGALTLVDIVKILYHRDRRGKRRSRIIEHMTEVGFLIADGLGDYCLTNQLTPVIVGAMCNGRLHAVLLGLWLAQGEKLTPRDVAYRLQTTRQSARRLLCRLARPLPIYPEQGVWQALNLREEEV